MSGFPLGRVFVTEGAKAVMDDRGIKTHELLSMHLQVGSLKAKEGEPISTLHVFPQGDIQCVTDEARATTAIATPKELEEK